MPKPSTRLLAFAVLGAVMLATAAYGALTYARWIDTTLPPAPDYTSDASWLCRPGRLDPCAEPISATIFEPNGRSQVVAYKPNPAPPIDCFYLYPTVSHDPGAYAPIDLGSDEAEVARRQFARFSTVCRPFAPLYRQVTVAGLPSLFRGRNGVTIDVPYADVKAAWRAYLARDNEGRGVVLVGHSQGSRLLARLMAEEIDGKPIETQLVGAILPGAWIDVPAGQRVGGTFHHIPLCQAGGEIGCLIAYSSFPAGAAIPANAQFGASSRPGMRDVCVDPMKLAGASHLDADLPLTEDLRGTLGTDFAALPGQLTSTCKEEGRFSVLAIASGPQEPLGEPTMPAIERLAQYSPGSGLHSLDLNLALGTLIDLVRKQTATYLRR